MERWKGPVYRYARRMLQNDQDAGDLTQEVLVKVLKSLDAYDPSRNFSTWVFSITRNAAIDHYRKHRRHGWEEPGEVVEPGPSPLQEASRAQEAARLRAALDQLAPMYREVLVLHHFEFLKYHEIAEALDLPMGTVMNRIFRARAKLRALYEQEQP